ncbi:MAG: oxygen-independent coproporphyrinogen-3 oxidase [Verrucomicrobiales bacterium]|jgi:oxygen-independent coproporphyrinogen-3 oxidase
MLRHVYIHIPFCHRICPYCSFYKHKPGGTDMSAFVDAILREIDFQSSRYEIVPHTIYFGGGTPSLFSTKHLTQLLTGISTRLDLSDLQEWDLEANPATFGLEKAEAMREHGVTRVSLGVQSLDPATLETLGRDHSPEEAIEAFEILRRARLPSVNLDLMFAIPGQSLATWHDTLERAAALKSDHVSCYNLTYEEDTEFFEKLQAGNYSQDHDEDASYFTTAMDLLGGSGFEHYEISNYAQPGFQSVHNRSYWAGHDYLGVGPGAVSTIHGKRWKNLPDTAAYIVADPASLPTEHETIDSVAFRDERIALQLRTAVGLPLAIMTEEMLTNKVPVLVEEGLLLETDDSVVLSRRGKLVADSVAAYLV